MPDAGNLSSSQGVPTSQAPTPVHSRSASSTPANCGYWEKECEDCNIQPVIEVTRTLTDAIYYLVSHPVIRKHPNEFYDVEIEKLADEGGDLSLMVYRNIDPSNGVRELLCWDFARTDYFTRDTTFEDIFKVLEMQLPGATHNLDVRDPIAELRHYAAKENYSLQWLYYSKNDPVEHKVILKKLNAGSQPTGEIIVGTDEFRSNACHKARKQLQDQLHKKFKFYRDRVVEGIKCEGKLIEL